MNTEIKLEEKVDHLLSLMEEFAPTMRALGDLLVEAQTVAKAKDLNPKTISQNRNVAKYNEIGHRKLLMRLEEVSVLRNRKRKEKGART